MRPIDADALMENLGIKEECKDCQFVSGSAFCGKSADFVDACAAICEAPTIEPNRGHWIHAKGTAYVYHCSCCGQAVSLYADIKDDFCRWCGADMRENEQKEM